VQSTTVRLATFYTEDQITYFGVLQHEFDGKRRKGGNHWTCTYKQNASPGNQSRPPASKQAHHPCAGVVFLLRCWLIEDDLRLLGLPLISSWIHSQSTVRQYSLKATAHTNQPQIFLKFRLLAFLRNKGCVFKSRKDEGNNQVRNQQKHVSTDE
jgi:hypothetical protein